MVDLSQLQKIETPEDIANQAEADAAVQYLKDTDWYVVRNLETGTPVPADIALARKEARLKAR